jgi:putative phosphoesterase
MRIGIIADIHDNIWALEDVLGKLEGCEALLCLGDVCSPFTYAAIGEGFKGAVHAIWGNNDGDRLLIVRVADKAGNITLHGDFAELNLGGRAIALTHYPHIGKALASSGLYDLVCYAHNHKRDATWMGKTLLLNPGEVMGRFGVRSLAIYDTERGEAEIVEV